MTTLITLDAITDGDIEGTGSFDKMMKSVSAHLQSEYDNGRIMGADYANVYASSLQGAMAQAMQFELTKIAQGAQADVGLEQAKQALIQTEVVTAIKQDQIDLAAAQTDAAQMQVIENAFTAPV